MLKCFLSIFSFHSRAWDGGAYHGHEPSISSPYICDILTWNGKSIHFTFLICCRQRWSCVGRLRCWPIIVFAAALVRNERTHDYEADDRSLKTNEPHPRPRRGLNKGNFATGGCRRLKLEAEELARLGANCVRRRDAYSYRTTAVHYCRMSFLPTRLHRQISIPHGVATLYRLHAIRTTRLLLSLRRRANTSQRAQTASILPVILSSTFQIP
jgi:hypothetical protein